MILENLTELTIADVLDRGVPNKECIAIQVNSPLNTLQYGILLGTATPNTSTVFPIRDNYYWFGEAILNAGDWIFLYTGSGNSRVGQSIDGLSQLYSLYWGRPMTMFYDSNVIPVLFRMDAIQFIPASKALPQT